MSRIRKNGKKWVKLCRGYTVSCVITRERELGQVVMIEEVEKEYKCNFCGSEDYIILADKDHIRFKCYGYEKSVVKCSACGLVRLYPFWGKGENEKLYEEYSQKKDFKGYKPKKEVSKYLFKYVKDTDRILEIGCGRGDNLQFLKNKGYHIVGIDMDPTVCDGGKRY